MNKFLEENLIAIAVSLVLGMVFWFLVIPFLTTTIFLVGAPPILEALLDSLVFGASFFVLNAVGFMFFGEFGGN